MAELRWIDVGAADQLGKSPVQEVHVGRTLVALTFHDGAFGAISGVCNHVGGPLGQGRMEGGYVVCPWHAYKYHCKTGQGEPGYEADAVPRHDVKVEGGRVLVSAEPATTRSKPPHAPHALERSIDRAQGPPRVLAISTTVLDPKNPRVSTSELLLEAAVAHARAKLGAEAKLTRLRDVAFRSCEGYYSKAARACTWPCSITQADPADGLAGVYDDLVFWADVVLVGTPIRWGAASALWFKLAERMNCIQNQITTHDRVLIRNKVAAFVITGGQDNIQAVAGQMLMFFGELGFHFPQFPFVAHSRGWTAEDMERNVAEVQKSQELRRGAEALAERAVAHACLLLGHAPPQKTDRGGRKARRLEVERRPGPQ
jgi:nitrite reductase/ring-hydroxylating ferredoxin subunit/multimeric flavodoxin WrbA